jgi:hypothetical protein
MLPTQQSQASSKPPSDDSKDDFRSFWRQVRPAEGPSPVGRTIVECGERRFSKMNLRMSQHLRLIRALIRISRLADSPTARSMATEALHDYGVAKKEKFTVRVPRSEPEENILGFWIPSLDLTLAVSDTLAASDI